MALQLGDLAPDFHAESTKGPIQFHDWLGDAWGVFFSHPTVNWQPGQNVIIAPSVSAEDARQEHPEGWQELKPYLRVARSPEP